MRGLILLLHCGEKKNGSAVEHMCVCELQNAMKWGLLRKEKLIINAAHALQRGFSSLSSIELLEVPQKRLCQCVIKKKRLSGERKTLCWLDN